MPLPDPFYEHAGQTIYCGDCREILPELSSVDLIVADPPYNIGSCDRQPRARYLQWVEQWCRLCWRLLSPQGTLWFAINDEYVVHYVHIAQNQWLTFRNWIIWHYTFGQHCRTKFGRSKTHLLYFCKDRKKRTWNADAIRVPSARQKTYNDKRANPAGRVPGDVWTFPRVCGTFKERVRGHPCQMPVALLERIILACSNPGDIVLDPFCGSGSTLVAAARCGRRGIGIEINEDYCKLAVARLKEEHDYEVAARQAE